MKNIYRNLVLLLFAGAFVFSGCFSSSSHDQEIKIVISKEGKSGNYSGWLKRYNSNLQWFNSYNLGIDSAIKLLKTSDGLLLTGGVDVFPGVYGKIKDTALCGTFDLYRDSLEFALIATALEEGIPIIGICRGEQILNISFGGTLHIDIPTNFDTTVTHRQKDWKNCYHAVHLQSNSLLHNLCGVQSGEVTSNHHQGIEILGKGLRISALSDDGLPEAIEWINPDGKSFLMAVQWHPERMDTLHPLSAPIAKKFLLEAIEFKEGK